MYSFLLHLDRESGKLSLQKEGNEIGVCEWRENRNTSQEIFKAMRELTEKEGIMPKDVAAFELETELPEHATARRIAETVKNVYTFGIST